MTKNADSDKYSCSGYGIGLETRGTFSLSDDSGVGKNVMTFGVDISSSLHADNRKKDIGILGKGPADGLDERT